MEEIFLCQGRWVSCSDVAWLRAWIEGHPDWSRKCLAKNLCRQWNWRTATGMLKDFAARSFLLKLQQRGLIELPPLRESMRRARRPVVCQLSLKTGSPDSVSGPLSELRPLTILIIGAGSEEDGRFCHYLAKHHYLGFSGTVGENVKYLVQDRHGRDLACVLFGSAAWKTAPRDSFIGWSDAIRQRNLNLLTNNNRFLVLPWVHVPLLASHLLGRIMRRLRADWQAKYAHPIHLVETFTQADRFRGSCYRAANWIWVGRTRGRSRQDRYQTLRVPVKDIYLYPLIPNFREELCGYAKGI